MTFLPGEDPLVWELWNCAMRFPKRTSNGPAMCQGVADEAVVAVKPLADEGVVTYPRTKLTESDREVEGEGRNKRTVLEDYEYSPTWRTCSKERLPWSGTT